MDLNDIKPDELVAHRGFKLINGIHDPDDVDQIYNLEIRDSDVFVVTYPKSGTIWMQQILLLIETKGDLTAISKLSNYSNADLIPWIEVTGNREMFILAPSPRLRVTHLQFHFMPPALSQKKGKILDVSSWIVAVMLTGPRPPSFPLLYSFRVLDMGWNPPCMVIYVARNPKDVLVSYFYFHKLANMLETPKDFNDFFEKFMRGDVFGCSWFEHIKTWYSHKDDMNMLFITYEEMIQDLQSAVERISLFLGKELTDEQLTNVVKHSTFNNMRKIPQANYEQVPGNLFNHHQGRFMRKELEDTSYRQGFCCHNSTRHHRRLEE